MARPWFDRPWAKPGLGEETEAFLAGKYSNFSCNGERSARSLPGCGSTPSPTVNLAASAT